MDGTTIIHRPVEEVAEYVLDPTNDVNWRHGVDESGFRSGNSIKPGAIGYTRVGDLVVEWEVLSMTQDESVDWVLLNGPFKGRGGYRFTSLENGTQFSLVADVEPTGIYKLLGPVFRWMGQRRNQSDVEKLRQILESRTKELTK